MAAAMAGERYDPALEYISASRAQGGPGNALAALLSGALGGASAPGRALAGEPVTYGDAWATALDFGAGGAGMAAPDGALRANGIRAYHGSPHSFDKFSMDKIGTGEGAQAYGHGLYFAEAEETAKAYRDALQFPRIDGAATPVEKVADDLNYHRGNVDAVRASYQGMIERGTPEAKALAQEKMAALPEALERFKGSMYEVNINADPADFLDWDAPWAEQPQVVKDAIMKRWADLGGTTEGRTLPPFAARNDAPMESIISAMSTSEASRAAGVAEGHLQAAGIPGIKYRDAGSRGADAADGTRNFVVFDENLINIVRKYGVAGAATMLGMTAAEVEAAMAGQQ